MCAVGDFVQCLITFPFHNVFVELELLADCTEDIQAVCLVRHVADQTLVQSAGSEKCRVDQVGSARGSQHIHSTESFSTVHHGQQHVDNSVSHTGTVVPTLRGNRIEFIEEQHTWLRSFGALKQISHALF